MQETWLRLSRTDVSGVLNLRAWLTTVVGRVALNMLESRGTRREDMAPSCPSSRRTGRGRRAAAVGPEDEALLGDEVSAALQVVLDTLEPRERLAFVLHDLFAVPFDDIAPVVDARARRRGSWRAGPGGGCARRRLSRWPRRWRPARNSSGRSWTRSSRRRARLSSGRCWRYSTRT